MEVHQRSSAFYSRAARGNCWNLHPALESSASPRREGERIEVRGFVNLQIQCAEPSPYPLPWGMERRTHAKHLWRDVAISLGEERARKLAN